MKDIKIIPSKVYKRWVENKPYKNNNSLMNMMLDEQIINQNFINTLETISLEDLIALKLESASRMIGGRLYGIPVVSSLTDIVKEAIFKFAVSSTHSHREAILFLGVTRKTFYNMKNKFGKKGILEKLKFIEYNEDEE